MNTLSPLVRAALAGALAVGIGSVSTVASAASDGKEQCAGVIKAGKNDCATSKNQCHGHVGVDRDPEAWIYVPKGVCERIAGAHVSTANDPTPGVKQ
jgi:uncharacterized membrane protein